MYWVVRSSKSFLISLFSMPLMYGRNLVCDVLMSHVPHCSVTSSLVVVARLSPHFLKTYELRFIFTFCIFSSTLWATHKNTCLSLMLFSLHSSQLVLNLSVGTNCDDFAIFWWFPQEKNEDII